jgi:LemA protein
MSYNNAVENFPNNIIAGMFNFKTSSFLEIESEEKREAPQVSFN